MFRFHGGVGVSIYEIENVPMQFMQIIKFYHFEDIDTYAHHLIISFERGTSISGAAKACAMLSELIGESGYQNIFAMHSDTDHIHAHFAINPINYITGHLWEMTYGECNKIRSWIAEMYI